MLSMTPRHPYRYPYRYRYPHQPHNTWMWACGPVHAFLLFTLFHTCSPVVADSVCTTGDTSTVCHITNVNLQLSAALSILGNGSVILNNSVLVQNRACDTVPSPDCSIQINMTGNVSLYNSTILSPLVTVYAGVLTLDAASYISASDQGNVNNGAIDGRHGGGGGHAGNGGYGCGQGGKQAGGSSTGSGLYPYTQGGAGSHSSDAQQPFDASGGGVVKIVTTRDLILNGTIASDGQTATNYSATVKSGGGAGGSIWLNINGSITSGPSASIRANGGGGLYGGGGGSGGRIHIIHPGMVPIPSSLVDAYGADSDQTGTCQSGASGTFVDEYDDGRHVWCQGNTQVPLIANTVIRTLQAIDRVVSVTLAFCSVDASQWNVSSTISLTTNSMLSDTLTNDKLAITCNKLDIAGTNARIKTSTLSIDAQQVSIGTGGGIHYDTHAEIRAVGSLDVVGDLDNPSAPGTSQLYINATTLTIKGNIQGHYVYIQANTVTLSGSGGSLNAVYFPVIATQPVISGSPCVSMPVISPAVGGLSLWVNASTISVGTGTVVTALGMALCSTNTTLQGSLIATGRACTSGQGQGHGNQNQQNQGSGAGHGGRGGRSNATDDGGATYDEPEAPTWVGSGGGATGGGNGGGYISVTATNQLSIQDAGLIDASGLGGTAAGAGGGSGGSVVLAIGDLSTSATGTINVNGGAGVSPGGGGGGGGLLHLTWLSGRPPYRARLAAIRLGIHLTQPIVNVNPGPGAPSPTGGAPGDIGQTTSNPTCEQGQGGLFCVDCVPGTHKADKNNLPCESCDPGTFNPKNASIDCPTCADGTFSTGGATICKDCVGGTFASAGASTCAVCDAGKYSQDKASSCTTCPNSTISSPKSSSCTTCAAGTWSHGGDTICQPCDSIPSHAQFVAQPGAICSYKCDPGYVFPDCLTPFQQLISNMGGPVGFAAILAGIVIVFSAALIFCFVRNKRRAAQKELQDMEEIYNLEVSHPRLSTSATAAAATSASMHSPTVATPRRKDSHHHSYRQLTATTPLLVSDDSPIPNATQEYSLQVTDLEHHLHRIYLCGNNSMDNALGLSSIPDPELSTLVLPEEYSTFAQSCTTLSTWEPWEKYTYYALLVAYYPVAHIFYRSRRKIRINRLWHFLLAYDHSFLRNYRARAMCDSLKFGVSTCSTLAWIDVLSTQQEDTDGWPVGKPHLPAVLVCCGTGSFYTPFHLDPVDVLVKSMSAFYGANWFKFMRSLNSLLRTIPASDIFSPSVVRPILEFINMMNHVGIGIGKQMPLHGLHMELGYVPPALEEGSAHASAITRPCLIITACPPRVDSAPRRRKGDSPRTSISGPTGSPSLPPPPLTQSPQSPQTPRKHRATQSIDGYASLTALTFDSINDTSPRSGSGSGSASGSGSRSAAVVSYQSEYDRAFGSPVQDDDMDSELKQSRTLRDPLPIPYNAKYMKDVLTGFIPTPPSARSSARAAAHAEPTPGYCCMGLCCLRNADRRSTPLVIGTLFGLALLCRIAITFFISITDVSVVPAQFALFLGVFPLVPVIAPLLGLLTLVSSSVRMSRSFAAFNLFSIINDVMLLIYGSTVAQSDLPMLEGLVIPAGGILSTLLLSWLGTLYIAHLETTRDLVMARRELLKDAREEQIQPDSPHASSGHSPKGSTPRETSYTTLQQSYQQHQHQIHGSTTHRSRKSTAHQSYGFVTPRTPPTPPHDPLPHSHSTASEA